MKYYTFDSKLLPSTIQAHANQLSKNEDKDGLFDQHRLIKGVYDKINFPIVFKVEYGSKFTDVLDTGWPSLYLISGKMKQALEANNLTGWRTFEIKLYDKKDMEITGYHGLSITGRCGIIDYSKSAIFSKRYVPEGPLCWFYKGLHVGIDQWDGSDFFMPQKYYGIILTQRAADILENNRLTNIECKNLEDIEIDEDPALV